MDEEDDGSNQAIVLEDKMPAMTPEETSSSGLAASGSIDPTKFLQPSVGASGAAEEQLPVKQPGLFKFNRLAAMLTVSAVSIILLVGVGGLVSSKFWKTDGNSANNANPAANYKVSNVPVQGISAESGQLSLGDAKYLHVNGQLQIGNTLVITPTLAPDTPVTGQVYYDKNTNAPYYFNGSQFISMAPAAVPPSVTSLAGVAGAIGVGGGLQVTNGQLTLTPATAASLSGNKVSSLQGVSGDVVLTPGGGIAINGTTISNTGVTGVTGSNGITVNQNGGVVSLALPQGLNTSSSPSFSQLTLSSALAINSGGTGFKITDLQAHPNAVIITSNDGSGYEFADADAGKCLISDSADNGKIKFGDCSGSGSGGITNIGNSDNAITIGGSTGSPTVGLKVKASQGLEITAGSTGGLGLISCTVNNQVLKYDTGTSSWGCAADNDTVITPDGQGVTSVGAGNGIDVQNGNPASPTVSIKLQTNMGLQLDSSTGLGLLNTCNNNQILKYVSGKWQCDNDQDSGGDGAGVTSVTGADDSIKVDNTNPAAPTLSVQLRSDQGIELGTGGLGLKTCTNNQILKYTTTGNKWDCANDTDTGGDGTGITDIGSIDGQDPVGEGASLSVDGSTLFLQSASADFAGLVNTNAQTFAGEKTFNDKATFSGGVTLAADSSIAGSGKLTISAATNSDLVLSWSGSGKLIFSGMDCSAMTNGGKLTVGSSGEVICAADTGGSGGAGLSSVSAKDTSIDIDESDGNNPKLSVKVRPDFGLVTNNPNGLGLLDTCTENQILKYDGSVWACANDQDNDTTGITSIQAGNGIAASGNQVSVQLRSGYGLEFDTASPFGVGLKTCDSNKILKSNGSGWDCADDTDTGGDGTGITGIGSLDGHAKDAKGAYIDGSTLYLQTADATYPGLVSTDNQVFAGLKTFNAGLTVANGQNFTLDGKAFTSLTGNGLQLSGSSLALKTRTNQGLDVSSDGVGLIACANGQLLKYNGTDSKWECQSDSEGAGGGDVYLVNSNEFTGTTNSFASGATTQDALSVTANNLTSGSGLKVTTSSTGITGNLVVISQNSAYDTTFTTSSKLLDVSRTVTGAPGKATVTLDAVSTSTPGSSVCMNDWTHTVNTSENTVLIVTIGGARVVTSGNNVGYPDTVSYGTQSMTRLSTAILNEDTWNEATVSQWILVNPDVGTHTITTTSTPSYYNCSFAYIGIASSWYNVDTDDAVANTSAYNNRDNLNIPVSVAAGQAVVDAFDTNMGTNTWYSQNPGSGQTQLGSMTTSGYADGANHDVSASTKLTSSYAYGPRTAMNWENAGDGAFAAVVLNPATVLGTTDGTLSGSVANISSNCSGCTETGNILSLQQSNANASGAVLALQNAGSGADIQLGSGVIRNATDSTTAVRIQTSTGSDTLFTADTTNNRLIVGNATASSGADTTLLVLDSAATANAPTGVNGGMYYDTTANKFMFYQNNAWVSYGTGGGLTAAGATGHLVQLDSDGNLEDSILDGSTANQIKLQTDTSEATFTSSAGLTISSGGSGQLTLTSASGTIQTTSAIQATGTIRSNGGFNVNGTAGANTTCGADEYLKNATITGGIITGGTCAEVDTGDGGGDVYLVNSNEFSGTSNSFASGATTQDALSVTANNLTSGSGLKVTTASASLTSGNLVAISQNSAYSGTFSASNKLLDVSRTVTGPLETETVTLDSASQKGVNTQANSLSWNHTVHSGNDRALIVSVAAYPVPSGVTYGGVSLNYVGTYQDVSYWALTAPAVGTASIVVTLPSNVTFPKATASSWFGVNQSDPIGSTWQVFGSPNTTTTLPVSVDTNQVVISTLAYYAGSSYTAGSGQTQFANPSDSGQALIAEYKAGPTNSLSWNITGGPSYKVLAVSLNPGEILGTTDGTLSGSVANISSNCSGCTETGNILSLQQSNTSASGAVLALQNAGSGADIQLGSGVIRAGSTSATAIRLQNSDGTNTLLSADTQNNRIVIGDASGAATALVLDSAASAPSGVNGAMYYDTTDHKFKFYQDGNWVSYGTGDVTAANSNNFTGLTNSFTSNTATTQDVFKVASSSLTTGNLVLLQQTNASATGKVLNIQNAGTGNALATTPTGNTGTTASTSGALLLNNTSNTGFGLNVYTNQSAPAGALAFFKADHTSFNREVIRVDNDGTGPAIKINANGNTGTGDSTSGALLIDNTNNTGFGLNVYSNQAASQGALVRINAANAGFSDAALYVNNNGTSGGAANVRLDGPAPQIEFVETDQDNANGKGKFELEVQGNRFWLNSRNAANTAFETVLSVSQLQSSCSGCVGIGIADAVTALQLASDGGNTASGISFGSAADTNLYRSEAGVLQTTGDLIVQGNISSPGTSGLSEKFGAGAIAMDSGTAFGNAARASGAYSIGIGQATYANGTYSVVIGSSATDNDSSNGVVIGQGASIQGYGSIAIGQAASTTQAYSLAIGENAAASGQYSVALGYDSVASNNYTVALGRDSEASGNYAMALGRSSTASGDYSVALGGSSSASGSNSLALGTYANTNTYANSIALGYNSQTTAANQLVIGSGSAPVNDVYIGNGVAGGSTGGFTLQASGAFGTDAAGATVNIAGGKGTGTGSGGDINMQIAKPGTTGSTLNSLVTVFNLSGTNGAALFKNAANSDSAFKIQNSTGTNLLVADTTNMKLTVTRVVITADLTVNGHIISGGNTPTTTIATDHIGTVASGATCTVTGTDTAGTITIHVGSAGGTNPINVCQVNFSSAFSSAPTVVVGAANNTAAEQLVMTGTTTTTSFQVNTRYYPTGNEDYVIKYLVVQ
jgi:hypothetical protein